MATIQRMALSEDVLLAENNRESQQFVNWNHGHLSLGPSTALGALGSIEYHQGDHLLTVFTLE